MLLSCLGTSGMERDPKHVASPEPKPAAWADGAGKLCADEHCCGQTPVHAECMEQWGRSTSKGSAWFSARVACPKPSSERPFLLDPDSGWAFHPSLPPSLPLCPSSQERTARAERRYGPLTHCGQHHLCARQQGGGVC